MAVLLTLAAVPALAQTAPPAAPPAERAADPEAKARFEKFRTACGPDLQTHCATVAKGTDHSRADMRQCIEANKSKFSAACQTAITEREANREARKQSQPVAVEKPKS